MLSTEQIDLIHGSWKKVVPIAKTAGNLFYNRLFDVAPSVKPLFKSPIEDQAGKLISMLGMVVNHLDKLDVISEQVGQLAARHNQYGAKPEHYPVVGAGLLGDFFFNAKSSIYIDARRYAMNYLAHIGKKT